MLQGAPRREWHKDCSTERMNPHFYRCLVSAGLVVALAGGSALHAAEKEDRSEQRAPEQTERKADKREARNAPSRFDTCKRDARGKQGPDRATFMTECLHDRH